MYLIKWRNRGVSFGVLTGLSRYTFPDACRQVELWRQIFPLNSYYIEKVPNGFNG